MNQGTVDERLDRLERVVEDVLNQLSHAGAGMKDWRTTIGMFDGDPLMRQIIDDAQRTREQERQRFYAEHDRDNGSP